VENQALQRRLPDIEEKPLYTIFFFYMDNYRISGNKASNTFML